MDMPAPSSSYRTPPTTTQPIYSLKRPRQNSDQTTPEKKRAAGRTKHEKRETIMIVPDGAPKGAPPEATAKHPGLVAPKGPVLPAQKRGVNAETTQAIENEDAADIEPEEEADVPAHGADPGPEDEEDQALGRPLGPHETEEEAEDTETATDRLAEAANTAPMTETSYANSQEAYPH